MFDRQHAVVLERQTNCQLQTQGKGPLNSTEEDVVPIIPLCESGICSGVRVKVLACFAKQLIIQDECVSAEYNVKMVCNGEKTHGKVLQQSGNSGPIPCMKVLHVRYMMQCISSPIALLLHKRIRPSFKQQLPGRPTDRSGFDHLCNRIWHNKNPSTMHYACPFRSASHRRM
jgi:hypothetical protein